VGQLPHASLPAGAAAAQARSREGSVAFFRYITDNPYRLLGVRSSSSYRELRQCAGAAAKRAAVGLSGAAALEAAFGADEMPRCADLVHALANNPREGTIYRLFWPFAYERPNGADGTLADLERVLTDGTRRDTFHEIQVRFLRAWFDFEIRAEPDTVGVALDAFAALYDSTEADDYLTRLLQSDGESAEDAYDVLVAAQTQVICYLLGTVCRRAIEQWEAGEVSVAVRLLETAIHSRFQDDEIDRALAAVVAVAGDRERAWIEDLAKRFEGWSPEQGPYDPTEVEKLRQLAVLVRGRVPAADLWLEAGEERVAQVAGAMRAYAIDLANEKSDHEGARRIIDQVAALPLPAEWEEQVVEDLARLDEILKDRTAWKDVKPTRSAPWLVTFNGTGFAAYGGAPFTPRPGWCIATYYFVVFFIPILPIARYLVSDALGGGRYFHGRLPLSRWNKYHLLVVLAVVLCCPFCSWLDDAYRRTERAPTARKIRAATSVSPAVAPHAAAASATRQKKLTSTVADLRRSAVRPVAALEPASLTIGRVEPAQRSQLLAEHERLVRQVNAQAASLSAESRAMEQARTDLRVEGGGVDQARQELTAAKETIDQARQDLENQGDAIDRTRQALDAETAQLRSDRDSLDRSDPYAVSEFNEKVDRHNDAMDALLEKVHRYERDREAFNEKADRYNSEKESFSGSVDRYNSNQDAFNRKVRKYNSRLLQRRRAIERLKQIEQALEDEDH
jgi:hypothetical protein